jgi:hypothetical protein
VYLVDTDVISAVSPSRPAPPALLVWMDTHSASLFLSAVTVTEIASGIAKARREGARRKSAGLQAWLETVLHLYGGRVLAFDVPTARIAGAMSDRARSLGHAPGLADIIVASTAEQHGLTILSRNIRHFKPLGVAVVDPFLNLPL